MTSYGYSVWAIMIPPQNISDLLARYNNFPHIPHITVKTNLTLEDAEDFLLECKSWEDTATISGKAYVLPNFYDHDPLKGWGFPAQLTNTKTEHTQHLTVMYSPTEIKSCPNVYVDEFLPVKLRIANTTSENPREWSLVTSVII
jgi:hypothetical protein